MIRIILPFFGPELITDMLEPVNGECYYEGFTATLE